MTAKVLYTDLDGTMVGPGGSFFAAGDGSPTLEPARALLDLHRAGVALVLVSGRTRPQLVEAARIFAADGFVAELGALIGWDGGRSTRLLTGAMPPAYGDRPPFEVMVGAGLPEELFARWPGRLQWHSPWHTGHEADAMVRGLVDVAEVEAWLAARGWDWLRLRDNGVLPAHRPWPGLNAAATPPHVYHLMPAGLSKGAAVAWDLRRRGLSRADAVAVGDSASDLGMAGHVGQLWVVANGADALGLRARGSSGEPLAMPPPLLAGLRSAGHDVRVTGHEMGLGWVEAVRAALER